MSTASGETSSDQPQRTSHQPGPLTILAATAIGGVIAARMGKAPFLLAAGAAALALLKQRKAVAPAPIPLSLPPAATELEIPAQNQVEQWLSRQIIREEQAPFVELSTADVPPGKLEDDYRPQSFLLDEADAVPALASPNDSFAGLTEPVPQQIPAPVPPMEQEVLLPPPQVFETPPPPGADAAWTLGVDPMPSLNEAAPYVAPAGSLFFSTPARQEAAPSKPKPPPSNMFSTAPLQQEEPGPPPFFFNSVFQGAALPDEIQVAPAMAPVPPMPSSVPTAEAAAWEPAPVIEPPPAKEPTPEIPVELAAPGDASFDPPLAAAPPNPWQDEPDASDTVPTSPLQSHASNPVVEAEIILRPRAPMQSTVTAKSKFAPPGFDKNAPLVSSHGPPADVAAEAPFPNPLQSPREPKPRPTWRSWWRGD